MIWFWVVALVLIIGASAVIIAGRGDAMTDVYEDRPDLSVDRGSLTADEVARVRFTTAVRGYRMDEVDAFVERLEAELRARSTASSLDEAVAVPEPAPKARRAVPGRRKRPATSSDDAASVPSVPGASEPPPESTDTPGDESVSSKPAGDPSR